MRVSDSVSFAKKCGLLFAVVFVITVLSDFSGRSQEVVYELLPGSNMDVLKPCFLTRDPIRVELQGTFVVFLGQSLRWVFITLLDLDFWASDGSEYHVTGQGYFSVSGPPPTWTNKCLHGFYERNLRVRLNDGVEQGFENEQFRTNEEFPCFVDTFTSFGTPVGAPECILILEILAAPMGEEKLRFFRRGDTNGNGQTDISDAVGLLQSLFSSVAPLRCDDAGDVNDDGKVELTDAVDLLNALFLERTQPPVPSCFCGIDPTEDDLGCNGQEGCVGDL